MKGFWKRPEIIFGLFWMGVMLGLMIVAAIQQST